MASQLSLKAVQPLAKVCDIIWHYGSGATTVLITTHDEKINKLDWNKKFQTQKIVYHWANDLNTSPHFLCENVHVFNVNTILCQHWAVYLNTFQGYLLNESVYMLTHCPLVMILAIMAHFLMAPSHYLNNVDSTAICCYRKHLNVFFNAKDNIWKQHIENDVLFARDQWVSPSWAE